MSLLLKLHTIPRQLAHAAANLFMPDSGTLRLRSAPRPLCDEALPDAHRASFGTVYGAVR